ncbi:MAG: MFS transporter [Alphaproteobacteria bacterium]|nr:MFS transporter [Alphaproteobacteria bacterium]
MSPFFSKDKRIIFASAFGNTLEYYDFTLYGLLCPVLSKLFFPQNHGSLSIFMALSLYAIGFLARPVGGIIFGYYGDKYGRKNALSTSILLMSLSCFIIGVLPTYQDIGIYAPALLMLARFLQGICVGGEYSGAVIFSLEHSPNEKVQNFAGSLLAASSHYGCLIASLIVAFFAYIQSTSIAWRIPFLLGSFIGIWGFYLRYKLPETPIFLDNQHYTSEASPKLFRTIFSDYKKELLCSIALISVASVTAGFSTAFLNIIFTQDLSFELHKSLLIISFGLVFYIIGSLFAPYFLKFFRATFLVTMSSILLAIVSLFIMYGLVTYHLITILLTQALFCSLSGIFWGLINTVIYEFFPPSIRYSGVAISDTIARTIFGGTIPIVLLFLKNYFDSLFVIGLYLSSFCIISAISCLFCLGQYNRQTAKNKL